MKALQSVFLFIFFCCAMPLFGQNPLVGTWEMKGDTIRSIKIITPTHWMRISHRNDSSYEDIVFESGSNDYPVITLAGGN